MRLGKFALAGTALLGMAALLSGCVTFKTPVKGKQLTKKKVEVKFKACESDVPGESGKCPSRGNSGEGADDGPGRMLIGFRVPKGTRTPPQIRSSAGFPIVLRKDTAYKIELNRKAPKRQNSKYFGYRSDKVTGSGDSGSRQATFKVKFRLPKGYDRRNFKVRPVLGAQALDLDEAVVCGPSVFSVKTGANSICIDSPSPSGMKNVRIRLTKR